MQQTPGRDVISLHAALMVKPATNIRWFVNENPHSREVLHIVKNTSTLQERLEDIRWQQRPRSSMLGGTLEAIQTKKIVAFLSASKPVAFINHNKISVQARALEANVPCLDVRVSGCGAPGD